MTRQHLTSGVAIAALLATTPVTFHPDVGWAAIDEMLVTTRKREENLQDVPIQVTAFGLEEIDRKGIDNLADVTRLTAGVILDDGGFAPQDMRLVVRGLSPTRGRQNVAILQDSIDVSSEAILTAGGSLLMNPRLFDAERVEIVKGPQMALYGRSAFAGAVNYISKKPGDEFEGRGSFDIGNYGQFEIAGGVSGPVVQDRLSLGINGAFWTHDGYYDNSLTGSSIGGEEGWGISASAVWNATDDLSFVLRAEYSDDEFEPRARAIVDTNTAVTLPAVASAVTPITTVPLQVGTWPSADGLRPTLSPDPRTSQDYPGTEREILRTTLTGDWDIGPVKLTSLTHYADADVVQFEDGQISGSSAVTATPSGVGFGSEILFDSNTELVSQELRLASNNDGPVNWMIGGLYWKEEVEFLDGSANVFNFVGSGADLLSTIGTTVDRAFRHNARETEHWSVFANVNWEFVENWTLTLEGRYVEEDLEVIGSSGNGLGLGSAPGGGVDVVGTDSDSFFTPKGTLEWTPNSDVLVYASVAQSIKPSGISTLTGGSGGFDPEANRFDQEKMLTYEIGAKTSWLDNTLQLNGSIFLQDFSDKQTTTTVILPDTGLLGLAPINASSAEIWGIELDAMWQPNDNWAFTASYAWLDAEYEDFTRATSSALNIAEAGNCTIVTIGTGMRCETDLSGNTLEGVPEHSFTGSAQYIQPIGNGDMDWFIETDVQFQDERFDSFTNVRQFDSYWLLDLRTGIQTEAWDVTAYVNNVLDDDTIKSGLSFTDFRTFTPPATIFNMGQALLPTPRTWGVRGTARF